MRLKISLFFLLITIISYSQNTYNLKQYGDESLEFLKRPVKWNIAEYSALAGFSAATYLLMHYDKDVKTIALMNQGFENSMPMKFGTLYGEPLTTFLLGTAFLTIGGNHDNIKNKRIGFEILQSFSYTLLTTGAVKIAFGRARPYMDKGAFNFKPFSFGYPDQFSFFSGHTSLAFSLSTILAANQEKTIYKALLYIPAAITGVSRVYHNKHWMSDVFMGAVTGYFIARWVHEQHDLKEFSVPEYTPVLNVTIGI